MCGRELYESFRTENRFYYALMLLSFSFSYKFIPRPILWYKIEMATCHRIVDWPNYAETDARDATVSIYRLSCESGN